MSFNRENVIWHSETKGWCRGFFAVSWVDPRPDADPEWDVEYDESRFDWVSTGHQSEEQAHRSWNGANPGGYSVETRPVWTERLDKMAADFLASVGRQG